MTEDFFKSEVVKGELDDLQGTYTELLKMSQNFQDFAPHERIDHINKTLELISKQKVFYSRLQMMVNYVEEDGDEPSEVAQMKERIDNLSAIYSGGNNLLQILQVMEDKLLGWKRDIQNETA